MQHIRPHSILEGENDLGKMPSKRLKVQGSTKRTTATPADLKQKALFGSENFVNGTRNSTTQNQSGQFGTVKPLTQIPQTPLSKHVSRQTSTKKVVAQQYSIPEIPTLQGKEEGGLIESPTTGKLRFHETPRSRLQDEYDHENTPTDISSGAYSSSPSATLISRLSNEKSTSGRHSQLLSRLESTKNKVQLLKGTPVSVESPDDSVQKSNSRNENLQHQPTLGSLETQRLHLQSQLRGDGRTSPTAWLNYIRFEYRANTEKRTLITLLKQALDCIPEETYVSSIDYSNLWVIYAKMHDSMEKRLNIYRNMQDKRIGLDNANFYSHWAHLEICRKNFEKAMEIVKLGYENNAAPVEKLDTIIGTLKSSVTQIEWDVLNNKLRNKTIYPPTRSTTLPQSVQPQPVQQPVQPVQQPQPSQQPIQQVTPQYSNPRPVSNYSQQKQDRYNLNGVREKFDSASKTLETKLFHVNGVPYIDLGLIGKGGSGRVYRVLSPNFKIFALKVVELKEDETFQQFVNEVQLLKDLKGKTDHIIEIIDSEIKYESKKLMILFEYAEIDLDHLLRGKNGKMASDLETLRFYWKAMLKAVEVVHENKIVHGDLKPANFVLVKGQLKLIDFGIAKAICGNTINIRRDDIAGTLNFMAPEAMSPTEKNDGGQQMKLGLPSDVWSLGCILYQMTYGHSPFAQLKDPALKFAAIVNVNYTIPFTELGSKMQYKHLLDVLKSCLDREPTKRPTIEQLLNHPFLGGE